MMIILFPTPLIVPVKPLSNEAKRNLDQQIYSIMKCASFNYISFLFFRSVLKKESVEKNEAAFFTDVIITDNQELINFVFCF